MLIIMKVGALLNLREVAKFPTDGILLFTLGIKTDSTGWLVS